MIKNVYWSSCKTPSFLWCFNETLTFSTDFRQMLKYQILLKFFKWGQNCSMRTDGPTDRHDEPNSRLSQFFEVAYKTVNFEDYCLLECEAVCYGTAHRLFYHIGGVGALLPPDVQICTATAMKTGNLSLSLHRAFCSLFN